MNSGENGKDLREWKEKEYCLQKDINKVPCCLWDGIAQKEDDLLYMLEEQTPIKDCADIVQQVYVNRDKENEQIEELGDYSQMKRRRMLQFNSNDSDVGINDEDLVSEFMKSKVGEDSFLHDEMNDDVQWILGFSDSHDDLDQSSESWLTSCFTESDIQFGSDKMNFPNQTDNPGHVAGNYKGAPQETGKVPVSILMTPCNKLKGRKSYISPTKTASSVAYPFEVIKPCGTQGDVTLKDINQRIHAPLSSKLRHINDQDSSCQYAISAFSGKPVVVKTKIRTEGGKGSITIMRTRG